MPIGTTVRASSCPQCRREVVPLGPTPVRCPSCGQALATFGYLGPVPVDQRRVS